MTDRGRILQELTRQLTDDGKLIEAGWASFRAIVYPHLSQGDQLEQLRSAFFAGAQHLFMSVMTVMDEDREPTEADLRRMSEIQGELVRFEAAFREKHGLAPVGRPRP